MIRQLEEKNFFFMPSISCTCYAPVPIQGTISSYEAEEEAKKIEIMKDFLYNQFCNSMKSAINAYKRSDLPTKFLDQKIIIAPIRDSFPESLGFYNCIFDIIALDADAFSIGSSRISGNFLYGHEVGHRIMHLKGHSKELVNEACHLLNYSDEKKVCELVCDSFGFLLDSHNYTSLISDEKMLALSQLALKHAWSL